MAEWSAEAFERTDAGRVVLMPYLQLWFKLRRYFTHVLGRPKQIRWVKPFQYLAFIIVSHEIPIEVSRDYIYTLPAVVLKKSKVIGESTGRVIRCCKD